MVTAVAVATTMLIAGSTPAQASTEQVNASGAPKAVIAVSDLNAQGYTDREIEAAIAGSPNVSIGYAPVVPRRGELTTQGVTFGKFIYVRISQAQAKAINAGSAAAAVGIIGLATGGIGGVIALASTDTSRL